MTLKEVAEVEVEAVGAVKVEDVVVVVVFIVACWVVFEKLK